MNYPPKNWLRSVVSRNSFNPEDFRFKRNPRHNWSAQRLTMVERMVSEQAKELVG